jgi:flagellar protein FlbD
MITVHRLGQPSSYMLNDDLIVTVEATPDTVISLAGGIKVVVAESPEEVAEAIRQWRASILAAASLGS